ncbi:MAG: hypothetical protein WCK65_06005 [Rhodospirillaceae bacterium]
MSAIQFDLFADQLSQLAAAIDALCLTFGKRLAANKEPPPATALVHLQAGDIAAQRVHHAAEAFAVLARLPIPADPELVGPSYRLQALQLRAATADFSNGLAMLEMLTKLSADGHDIIKRLECICAALDASADTNPMIVDDGSTQRARLIDMLRPHYTMAAEHAILAAFLANGMGTDMTEPSAKTDDDLVDAIL